MKSPQRYLFDRSFDPEEAERRLPLPPPPEPVPVEPAEPEPPPPPPPPMFSLEELAAASDRARSEGHAAGRAAAMRTIEQQTVQALTQITGQFNQLLQAQARSDAALLEQALLLSLAVTRRLFPHFARRHGAGEIEAVVRDCFQDMLKEPRIVVRVAGGLLDAVRPLLDDVALTLGYEGAVVLLADPALAPGDCRVEWAEGGAERLSEQIWQSIDAAVARLLDRPLDGLTVAGRPVTGRAEAAAPALAATA